MIEKDKKGIVKLAKGSHFNPELLPVIQNLLTLGYSEADIGFLVGWSGKNPKNFLKKLKQRNKDVKEICETGKQLANIFLVSKAVDAATRTQFEEITEYYRECDKEGNKLENPIKTSTKKVKKPYRPDGTLLLKLLESRMPEVFSLTKKMDKRSLNVDVEAKLQDLLGMLDRKKVESKEIENDRK